ncbi:SpoIIE family protein phosphatase [Thermodesulfobacteriota bacterium]
MRYRWKLLVLFLTMTLVPIFFMRTFGIRAVKKIGTELISRMSENRIVHMQQRLRFRLDSYSKMVWAGRKQIELALLLQVKEVERCLSKQAPMPAKIYFANDFNEGINLPFDTTLSTGHFRKVSDGSIDFLKISYSEQVFKIAPGVQKKNIEADIARLSTLTPVYKDLSDRLQGGFVSWHLTSLENGLHSAYPGHNAIPWRLDARIQPWYTTAIKKKLLWTEPYVDPETRQIVVAATMPVNQPAKTIKGVTALVIPISKFLARSQLAQNISPETRSFMTYLATNPKTGQKGIQIYAREEYTDIKHRYWRGQLGSDWLTSSDAEQYRAMIVDFVEGKSNTRKMPYRDRDSLWVYGPAHGGPFLVLITPYEEILKGPRQAKEFVQSLIGNLLSLTRYGLIFIVLLVVIGAFSFSRTITKPIQALVEGFKRLAEGQFDSRVDIRSRDEFRDMGKVFNSVGPRLKEHSQMRQSLALAKEVQQNLLPKDDPKVNGLDIAGESIYCDGTGGDYYDYLNIEADQGKISIVVGDVSEHGIPSALLMTTARALLRRCSATSDNIQQIVSEVNFYLTRDIEESGRFMSLFYSEIDSQKKYICWVRAGHDPAILFDPVTDSFYELVGKGLPLGVFDNSEYEESKRDIAPGQIIVIGTDGIWEATNPNREMFGKKRLRNIIHSHAERPAKEIMKAVIDAVDQFCSPLDKEDDVTLVIVKIE